LIAIELIRERKRNNSVTSNGGGVIRVMLKERDAVIHKPGIGMYIKRESEENE